MGAMRELKRKIKEFCEIFGDESSLLHHIHNTRASRLGHM
jgi:hypothetical protein